MKKVDSRYIIIVFLIFFILRGIIEFVFKGNDSFTLNEIYFRFLISIGIVLEILPIGKGWRMFRFFLIFFLSQYLPKTIFDHLGMQEITIMVIPYFIISGLLFIALFIRINIKTKKDFPTHLKKEN